MTLGKLWQSLFAENLQQWAAGTGWSNWSCFSGCWVEVPAFLTLPGLIPQPGQGVSAPCWKGKGIYLYLQPHTRMAVLVKTGWAVVEEALLDSPVPLECQSRLEIPSLAGCSGKQLLEICQRCLCCHCHGNRPRLHTTAFPQQTPAGLALPCSEHSPSGAAGAAGSPPTHSSCLERCSSPSSSSWTLIIFLDPQQQPFVFPELWSPELNTTLQSWLHEGEAQ